MVKKYKSTYVPKTLSESDKKKQIKSIKEKTERPKIKSFQSRRSSWTEKFEKKYGYKITNDSQISKNIISKTGIKKILERGMAAYLTVVQDQIKQHLVGHVLG